MCGYGATFVVSRQDAERAVATILGFLGEDPTRDGLVDTPRRVVKAWQEMTAGYAISDEESLSTVFDEPYDEMVVLTGIEFTSTCEHHMLPFHGIATVGYIPNGGIVGLSKLARVVTQYAQRLQNQERITAQVADAIERVLDPLGVGVILEGHHLCMSCRGVKQPRARMVTSVMRGAMDKEAAARSEFMALHKR
jgi:GTP cyclohydrolase IA